MKKFVFVFYFIVIIIISGLNPSVNAVKDDYYAQSSIEGEKVSVTFSVKTPYEVSSLEIQILYLIDPYYYYSYQLSKNSQDPNVFEINLELPKGKLLRYRYSLGGNQWEYLADTNPSFRTIVISEVNTNIEDNIVGFCPSFDPSTITRLNVTGRVVEQETDKPIEDGFVAIGGVITPLRANGSFYAQNVFSGYQHILVFSYSHLNLQSIQNLSPDTDDDPLEIDLGTFSLEKTRLIRVTFIVKTPENTQDKQVKIVGDLPQLGYIYPYMVSTRNILLQHVKDNWFIQTLEIPEHVPFNYFYTLGSYNTYYEVDSPNPNPFVRSIYPENNSVIVDEVGAWKNNGYVHMKFTVNVPENTPQEFGVSLVTSNSFLKMNKLSSTEWYTELDYPEGWEFNYYYAVGEVDHSIWESEYNNSNPRTKTASEGEFVDTVSKWNYIKTHQTSTESSVNVSLVFTVPSYTPDVSLYLAGELFDNWVNPQGQLLQKLDAHSYCTFIVLDKDIETSFTVTRGIWASSAKKNFTLIPKFEGEVFYFSVDSWIDLSPPWNRTSLITGVMPIDYWSSDMRTSLDPAFKHFAELGGKWIEYSPIWNYDRLKPFPYLSSTTGVYTPDEDLAFIVETAKKYGLRVGISLQINTEQTADSSQWGDFTAEEIDVLLEGLKTFYFHYAELSQKLGIEFITFARLSGDWINDAYDTFMINLIPEIREIYSGMLTTHQGWTDDFQYYGLLDFIGFYFWESVLAGTPDPTVDELTTAFEEVIDTHYRPFYEKYQKPIIFTQVVYAAMEEANGQPTIPSIYEGTTVEYRPDIQARIYEALYRAIANRTWIEGLFSFGWKYWPSHFPEYSISYTPAETVVAKWSNMVNYGNGVIVNNENKVKVEQEDFILHLEESGFYTDIRLRDSEGNNWSSWNIYQTTIDLSTILPEISTEKQYVIWLQAKNSTFTSNPTAVKVIVDSTAPKISTQPTSYDFNLSSFNSLGKIVEETSLDLLTFVFDDTSSINVEAQVTGAENYTINTTGNVFTLPIILFTEGDWKIKLNVYDEYNHLTTTTFEFSIFSIESTTPPKFTSIPEDLTFEEGSTGHTLTWIVTDTNPSTYTIYSNGTEVTSGSWLSDQA
ncbi:MAG: glycoside hydrolase family 113, partial [Candidatus Heimdallarchaeaceae archaeon]